MKADATKVQNAIDYQGGTAQNQTQNQQTDITRRSQALENRYNVAADRGEKDYGDQMAGYGNFMQSTLPSMMTPHLSRGDFGAYSGYQNFADTGGYSGNDISAIRARGVAPIRSAYAGAQRDIDRQKAIQGGYAPNYIASKAKLTRDIGQSMSDANVNVEASLADQIRQGKLAGLGGMTGIDSILGDSQFKSAGVDLSKLGLNLDALKAMSSLYSATPGMASMYGNQMLNSSGQNLDAQQLQNQLAMERIRQQIARSQVPSNFQQGLGNVGGVLNLGGKVAGAFTGIPGGGSSGSSPYGLS